MSKLDVVKSLSPRGGVKHDPESFYNFEGHTLVGNFPKSKGECPLWLPWLRLAAG